MRNVNLVSRPPANSVASKCTLPSTTLVTSVLERLDRSFGRLFRNRALFVFIVGLNIEVNGERLSVGRSHL